MVFRSSLSCLGIAEWTFISQFILLFMKEGQVLSVKTVKSLQLEMPGLSLFNTSPVKGLHSFNKGLHSFDI